MFVCVHVRGTKVGGRAGVGTGDGVGGVGVGVGVLRTDHSAQPPTCQRDVVAELVVHHHFQQARHTLCGVDCNGLLQQQSALVPVGAWYAGARAQRHRRVLARKVHVKPRRQAVHELCMARGKGARQGRVGWRRIHRARRMQVHGERGRELVSSFIHAPSPSIGVGV